MPTSAIQPASYSVDLVATQFGTLNAGFACNPIMKKVKNCWVKNGAKKVARTSWILFEFS